MVGKNCWLIRELLNSPVRHAFDVFCDEGPAEPKARLKKA